MALHGLIDVDAYERDPTLRSRVKVVPFGLPDGPPPAPHGRAAGRVPRDRRGRPRARVGRRRLGLARPAHADAGGRAPAGDAPRAARARPARASRRPGRRAAGEAAVAAARRAGLLGRRRARQRGLGALRGARRVAGRGRRSASARTATTPKRATPIARASSTTCGPGCRSSPRAATRSPSWSSARGSARSPSPATSRASRPRAADARRRRRRARASGSPRSRRRCAGSAVAAPLAAWCAAPPPRRAASAARHGAPRGARPVPLGARRDARRARAPRRRCAASAGGCAGRCGCDEAALTASSSARSPRYGLSVLVLAALLTKGRALTGADGLLAVRPAAVLHLDPAGRRARARRQRVRHGARRPRVPAPRLPRSPGLLHAVTGISVPLSYLLWKPVAVGAAVLGRAALHAPAAPARRPALRGAGPRPVRGDAGERARRLDRLGRQAAPVHVRLHRRGVGSAQYLWGYLMTAIAVALMPLVLLAVEGWRARGGARRAARSPPRARCSSRGCSRGRAARSCS